MNWFPTYETKMNPVRFPEANIIMRAPPSMVNCSDIHAFTDHSSVCVTLWQPTSEERAAIAAGGSVYLRVEMGGGMPPVSLSVLSPFIQPPDEERLEAIAEGAPSCGNCHYFSADRESHYQMGTCDRWKRPNIPSSYLCDEHLSK